MKKRNGAKKALQEGVKENSSIGLKTNEKKLLGVSKQQNNPSKNPAGRGLGKAGAKRLGRLLKRVVQPREEPVAVAALPKTPVRLFKHQFEKKADDAPAAKFSKQQVSKLVLNVVSQCKHKGGISMDELKETLAAEGYDVAKNKRQVTVVTEQLVDNKTLVRNKRNASLRLNKKVIKTKDAKTNKATSQKPPQEPERKTPAQKNPKETKAQKNNKNLAKAKAKIQRNTGKAAQKSKKQRQQSPKPKRKPQKRARKRPQLGKNRPTRAQTPPAKTKKTHRHQPKQVKSSRRKQSQRLKLPTRTSKRQKKHRRCCRSS